MKMRAKFIAGVGAAIALISLGYVAASALIPEVERGVVGLRLVMVSVAAMLAGAAMIIYAERWLRRSILEFSRYLRVARNGGILVGNPHVYFGGRPNDANPNVPPGKIAHRVRNGKNRSRKCE